MSTETTRSVVIEREMPHPPEKVWRALTQSSLLKEWLMKNDFQPIVGHRFNFRADWGAVDGEVLAVEPNKMLSYGWAAFGLESVVTWTLTPTSTGTHLRIGAVGLPNGSGAGLQGRQVRVAGILRGPGEGFGTDRVILAAGLVDAVA
jgi:uncharacterized protein YndB with AHSA1/START domain